MRTLTLTRFCWLDAGVLGELRVDGATMFTLEPPWRFNAPYESCVPNGDYELVRFSGPRWPNTWELKDVPGRSAILIHPANYVVHPRTGRHLLMGCIAPGESWQIAAGAQPRVWSSRAAFDRLRDALASADRHELRIQSQGT